MQLNKTSASTTPPKDFTTAWKKAKELVEVLVYFPATFTVPIRTLLHDDERGTELSTASQFLVMRLLKSPTLKAMLYYSALTFYKEAVTNNPNISSADIIRLFKPREVAGLLGTIYLYRRFVTLNARELYLWKEVENDFILRTEIAGHLGQAIPSIGRYKCFWSANAHNIGMTILGLNNPEAYKQYRRYLFANKLRFDYEYENKQWGCTNLDVTCNVLQQFGFGVKTAHALMVGTQGLVTDDLKIARDAYEYGVAQEWINSLMIDRQEPKTTHLGEYYPLEKDKLVMLSEVDYLMSAGSKHEWLRRTKNDITAESTPQLYQELLLEAKESSDLKSFYEHTLPDDVLKDLSAEDMNELSKVK